MTYSASSLLGPLLRDVSRSFYLTLRVLPSSIRPQISLAYLLARTTDTIADTNLVALEERLAALQVLLDHIQGRSTGPLTLGEFARNQGSAAERSLLEKCPAALDLLHHLPQSDRELVVAVLETIVSGQELDLRRFAAASRDNVVALQNAGELDDYTYRVAGCVGEFWTKICRRHVFASAALDEAFLLGNAVRFGKGLQLVNILRDLPSDLRNGRCYLPLDQLKASGLLPHDLLDPANEARLRPMYNGWLDQAGAHLAAGWSYTTALPRRCFRVRLACAWPLLVGVQTIDLLRTSRVLDPSHRVKVPRAEVRAILRRSVLYYPWRARWDRLFRPPFTNH